MKYLAKKGRKFIFLLFFLLIFVCQNSFAQDSIPDPTPNPFLTSPQYSLLEELLNTHLNYFLSNDAITSSGFPLGAYKEGNRGRYNYSNPTEWGYAMLAWITAADRGEITLVAAASKIETALDTMIALQADPAQNYQYLFYPYYYVATPGGVDLAMPYHDANVWIPSIDNGFLYTSLLITQGWADINGLSIIKSKSGSISSKMNFRVFLEPSGQYLAHLVNASTGVLSASHWDIYSDEGGMMAWIAYASGSVTFDEYKVLITMMQRPTRQWNSIVVKEAAWFNAMFTWGVRPLGGFPVGTWETGITNQYSVGSFAKVVQAHLAYGEWLGAYYPAFSDAMTQAGCTGRYTPPNIPNNVPTDIPAHVVPHALFIPFCIGPDIVQSDLTTLIAKITDLKNDSAQYYHDGSDLHKPFGFEVTASSSKDNTSYPGVESRYIFETLSEAYTVLSIQQGLNINDGNPTFLHYACKVPGYFTKIQDVLTYLYSGAVDVINVPADYPTIQAAIDAASSGDTILVSAGTYNESVNFNKSGVTLRGESKSAVIQGVSDLPAITCSNLSGGNKAKITNFTIYGGPGAYYAIECGSTVSSLQIEDNFLSIKGISLNAGSSVVIKNNEINNCRPIIASLHNNIQIIGNTFKNTIGPNPPGISLDSVTGLIKDNYFSQRWDGALYISNSSNVDVVNNIFTSCYAWNSNAGVNVTNSTVTIRNNLFRDGHIYSTGSSCGVYSSDSSVSIYNNLFFGNNGHRGVCAYINNSNFIAKNNIFTNNSSDSEIIYIGGSGTQDFSYNNIWNNTASQDTTGVIFGPGNIALDPLFVDTNNFGLGSSSPCRDSGDPAVEFNDLNSTRNDMGIQGGPYGFMPYPPRTYNEWKAKNFTPEQQADPNISGETADPDQDNIPNLYEYAFNLNPLMADPSAFQYYLLNNHFTIKYRKIKSATDLTYQIGAKNDLLGAWDYNAFTITETQDVDVNTQLITATDSVDSRTVMMRFFKLQVTRQAGQTIANSFAPDPSKAYYSLDVAKSGSGNITSESGNIDCGTDCYAEGLKGTSDTLIAQPAAGYKLATWSGACSGTSSGCTVTYDAQKQVMVSFLPLDTTPPVTTISSIPSMWSTKTVTVALTASDDLSGIKETLYSLDGSEPNISYTAPFVLGDGIYTIKYYSIDQAGNQEETQVIPYQLKIDTTAPAQPIIRKAQIRRIRNLYAFSAAWSCSDNVSGITEYQYRITERSPSGIVIRRWRSTGTNNSVTIRDLQLRPNRTYYLNVKAKNGAGLWSNIGYSKGIKVTKARWIIDE